MTASPSFLGAIIAGGGSRRFGAPKALAEIAGLPMIEWSLRALVDAERQVVVGGDPAVAEALGVGHLPDAAFGGVAFGGVAFGGGAFGSVASGGGPLAGLVAALESARDLGLDGVFALACDVPLVTSEVVGELVDGAGAQEAVAAQGPLGAEPLCAFYGVSCLEVARAHLESENRSLKSLLDELPLRTVDLRGIGDLARPEDLFMNVNTPEDARRAEGLLASRRTQAAAPNGSPTG